MSKPITITNTFAAQTGPIPLSQLDADFTQVVNAINDPATYQNYVVDTGAANVYVVTPNPAWTAYAAGMQIQVLIATSNTGASTLNVSGLGAKNIITPALLGMALGELPVGSVANLVYDGTQFQLIGGNGVLAFVSLRSYLSGCTLSTAGASTTMSIAAGLAMDVAGGFPMVLSAIAKTTSAWAVGTATGGLDTGAIANSTWYHFYVIKRIDTSVVDVVFSLNATTPTLPTNYTAYRRIGSGKTNGSAQWTAFIQVGDYFRWLAQVSDVTTTNPGTAAVTSTLTVPTGVQVTALMVAGVKDTGATAVQLLVSDLAATDTNAYYQTTEWTVNIYGYVPLQIMTNTSAQVRYRSQNATAGTTVNLITEGWLDARGKNT